MAGKAGGHVREYNFKELETLLKTNGFRILDRTYADMAYARKIKLLEKIFPMTFAEKIVIRAQKD